MSSLAFRANVASAGALTASRPRVVAAARAPLCVEARVHIRFSRFGKKHYPVYRIVAIDSRDNRQGRPLEWLGHYNPHTKEVNLNAPNIKKWLDTGAQPTDSVRKLLKRAMVLDA